MKKYLIVQTILLLTMTVGHGQTNVYHNFPDSNAIWSDDVHNSIDQTNSHVRYGINGDTIINGTNYKKIYLLHDSTFTNPLSTYYAAIREQDKKVYTLIEDFPELLLYDFNLSLGDTIYYYYSIQQMQPFTYSRVVSSIDSIQLLNGQYRKQYNFSNGINCLVSDIVVEGIGSITWMGLFNPLMNDMCTCGDDYTFSCFKQNDTTLYLNNSFCNYCFCGLGVGIDNIEEQEKPLIFPNPFSLETNLRTNKNLLNGTLTVYNSYGQQVKQIKNISGNSITLNRDNLLSGLYLIRLSQDNKIFTSDKLIIIDK